MSLPECPFILLRSPLESLDLTYNTAKNVKPIFEEGLYLSSPAYWQEFKKRDKLIGKDREKLERSFIKYWIRSCMRCTPYGTFAGSTIIDIRNQETQIVLADNNGHRRRMRVDMNYITELISAITQLPHIQSQLKFYPNNSIYELANDIRYAEYTINDNTRKYQLTAISNTTYVKAILQFAARGATIDQLANLLKEQEEVSITEATDFIVEMLQAQLLVSQLEPCITGNEPLEELVKGLGHLEGTHELYEKLSHIQTLINNPVQGVDHYQAIEEKLENLGIDIVIPKNTLQTDLFLDTRHRCINSDLINEIIEQTEHLRFLAREKKNDELNIFKSKFISRYEDAEMPLSIVIDADYGIGYANAKDENAGVTEYIDDLLIINRSGSAAQEQDYIEQFVLVKYNDHLKQQTETIEIIEAELLTFKNHIDGYNFSNSVFLMGSILKKNNRLDKDNFLFDIRGFGGPSAGNLLGRFTHGDQELCTLTKEILQAEEKGNPDAIYAEIVHLPQARIGNILLRPLLRNYEIPYVGQSGAPLENQIRMEDLMVSIQNNEVVLRSKKHNKRVIPRLTTAHNFTHRSLPAYKFLCDLQSQGIAYPNVWDWGILSALKSLPRVTYKNLILQKAKWKISVTDIQDLPDNVAEHRLYFQNFCEKYKLPNRVVYAEADNELLIDFTEDDGIDLFLHYLKRYTNIQLEEFLFTRENAIVQDVNGQPFTNEVILPLSRATRQESKEVKKSVLNSVSVVRKFPPNSEWQYFKVYCGSKTAEKILRQTILPFIERGIGEQLFERFFFIRYRDEFGHFRIRFYNSDRSKQAQLQVAFMDSLGPSLNDGTIDKVMLDTYNREIERYTECLIAETEILYHNDSLAVLRFLAILGDNESEKYRMVFAVRGIDMLLGDFHFTLEQKQHLLKSMQKNFFHEFGASPKLQKQLNEKYRKYQQFFFKHMHADNDTENEVNEAATIFTVRSAMNKEVVVAIRKKLGGEGIAEQLPALMASYIHMFMNRLFIAQQRKYELVVYHFLEKYYTSQLAISKQMAALI